MKEKEENPSSAIMDGVITGIKFGLATRQEICTSSNSDCPISHASQLTNPFLGLPLESGKCESCGTAEAGECEGHFGYIELPVPIYHPSHVSELKRLLSFLCLKCLKIKNKKHQGKNVGVAERVLSSCCEEASQVSISEAKTAEGACYLELKIPSRSHPPNGFWNFLERYGFRYGDVHCRPLLPSEVMVILRKIPQETKKKLSSKGFFPQEGYILQHLPVPPNCLSVPDVSDGSSVMSSDHSIAVLKKVLKQADTIKSSRSGTPNFESSEIEANDLQVAVSQYLEVRGTAKASRDVDGRFGIKREGNSSTKVWLEKMRTLFIRKGSGFSSRSIITGDPYKGVGEIGLPFEIAQRITFEEKVSEHNMMYLQKLVDQKLCLTYRDGSSTYSLREGSKGHTFLRPGQVVHRRIMDGDIVFINRPPTTHKHSLQALAVYVHDDHTVKINPLICAPLSADFDGDAIHLFYPQSLAAKAEVLELFSVEKQLLSSHSGNLNLQLATDSLLSLKLMFKNYFFSRAAAQQLALFVSGVLPSPAVLRARNSECLWTVLQLLQTVLPANFDCCGESYNIWQSKILHVDYSRDLMQSVINDVVSSLFFEKGPVEVLRFFDYVQPMLMESLFSEGFSVGLEDFFVPKEIVDNIQTQIQEFSSFLYRMRSTHNELIGLQLQKQIRHVKGPIASHIQKSSAMGYLIDSKSESAISKVVQQIGFLGLQISDKGKFYSKTLVADIASLFQRKYPSSESYPSEEYGLVRGCLFHGLDPYQSMVHSVSSREIIVRSSRGLTEPGTLFKNLMAILRDVVICYDGTVRNVCSNSIIQFEYGTQTGALAQSVFAAGEPVGVLAATAMSNPAYKAVLDSSPSSNSSWAMMKEILLCGVKFKNDQVDRRVILYLNNCDCGRKHCGENAAYLVKKQLQKVSLKDAAVEFLIEYNMRPQIDLESSKIDAGLVGHVHLKEVLMNDSDISIDDIYEKCQDTVNSFKKKKRVGQLFKYIDLSVSQSCSFGQSSESKGCGVPCLRFFWKDNMDIHFDRSKHIFADTICPVLLETIVKGDPRVCSVDIIWVSSDTTSWIRNPSRSEKGELAIDVVLEKKFVKQSGDAWRILLDSCLPVMHVIDTRRSVPYSVKQLQELLGISCAFEQAIQRLSSSVTMVTKGVLKEHLLLLANSMTFSGNLVGFNKAGIKALSRSLNVQVPFTEATLFTPKKCFETAAEKCHVDSLTSIVASCSWGKHVAVGTGSSFDLLWDTREAELSGTDVYDFLNLVRSSSGVEKNSACIGAEIDDLDWTFEYDEAPLSPENASEKPVFEDSVDFEIAEQNGWEKETQPLSEADGLWGRSAEDSGANAQESAWDKKVENGLTKSEDSKDVWGEVVKKSVDKVSESAWGSRSGEGTGGWGNVAGDSDGNVPESGWTKKSQEGTNGWAKAVTSVEKAPESAWGKKSDEETSGWGPVEPSRDRVQDLGWQENDDLAKRSEGETGNWGKVAEQSENNSPVSGWGKTSNDVDKGSKEELGDAWGNQGKRSEREDQESGWGGKKIDAGGKKPDVNNDTWGEKAKGLSEKLEDSVWTKKADSQAEVSGEKAQLSGWDKNSDGNVGWKKKDMQSLPDKNASWSSPATDVDQAVDAPFTSSVDAGDDPNPAWGNKSSNSQQSDSWSSWSQKTSEATESQWSKKDTQLKTSEAAESQWSKKDTQPDNASGLGSSPGWTKKEGWGPSNAGEGRPKRGRPFKAVGGANDESVASPMTATGKRLDLFTADEQELLVEIEPIMQTMRRIMNPTGYNDGDPLAADDQTYIIDHVLKYHPSKAEKMGTGIDYIMINKHSSFQDTRCLYIVCTDGRKEDFSYRKCLENFMKEKFPDRAEAFMEKYMRRNQAPRPGWNKDRNVPETANKNKPRGWGNKEHNGPEQSGNSAVKNKRKGWGNGWGNDEHSVPEAVNKSRGWGNDPEETAAEDNKSIIGWGNDPEAAAAAAENKSSVGWGDDPEPAATQNKSSVGWGDDPEAAAAQTKSSVGWGDGAEAAAAAENKSSVEKAATASNSSGWGSGPEGATVEENSGGWGNAQEAAATEKKSGGWGG